jgi:hypothetical protein
MSDEKFKELGDRAYVSHHQDGIIDILLGASIFGFGLQMLTGSDALMLLTWMPFLFYMPLKNHITAPRHDYARFGEGQDARAKRTRLMLISLLVIVLLLGVLVAMIYGRIPAEAQAFLGGQLMLLLGGLAALMLAVASAVTGLKRLYVYAALTLLFNAAGTFLPIHEGWAATLLGVTIMISGFWLLARFLRAFPRIDAEDGRTGQ